MVMGVKVFAVQEELLVLSIRLIDVECLPGGEILGLEESERGG
jgi:hypothetical protein